LQPRCAALLRYFFAGVSSGITNPIKKGGGIELISTRTPLKMCLYGNF
jgi:hypothetical protein